MTVNEAKKILLAAQLSPTERNALYILLSKVDCEDLPNEIWRDVVGYEGDYQVSNFARVKSFKKGKIQIRKVEVDLNGYVHCGLHKNGKTKHAFLHVLVAQAFISNLEGKTQVNHINGIKTDNRVENLEWVTPAENIAHAFETGLRKSGCEHFRAKLTAEQVREIRRDCVHGDLDFGVKAFARKFNVTPKIISDAYYGESYKDVE